ncbi:MAG: translation initiation factor IF-3 [Candidatus Gracilibacteria bacterium]|nr:translation initiation factor IF-3 [Candidatus Gracilibacteria bacterium]
MKEKKRNLNGEIRAKTVQLITDQGENFGEMSLSEARKKAEENNLDLMEMSKAGEITIIKMLDYGKFLYKQKKQDQKNKQKGKAPDLKTIRITFKIGEHDLEIRTKQAQKFAIAGHPLKVSLMLRGRENQYGDIALDKMNTFVKGLSEIYKADSVVKRSGNTFTAMLKPIK